MSSRISITEVMDEMTSLLQDGPNALDISQVTSTMKEAENFRSEEIVKSIVEELLQSVVQTSFLKSGTKRILEEPDPDPAERPSKKKRIAKKRIAKKRTVKRNSFFIRNPKSILPLVVSMEKRLTRLCGACDVFEEKFRVLDDIQTELQKRSENLREVLDCHAKVMASSFDTININNNEKEKISSNSCSIQVDVNELAEYCRQNSSNQNLEPQNPNPIQNSGDQPGQNIAEPTGPSPRLVAIEQEVEVINVDDSDEEERPVPSVLPGEFVFASPSNIRIIATSRLIETSPRQAVNFSWNRPLESGPRDFSNDPILISPTNQERRRRISLNSLPPLPSPPPFSGVLNSRWKPLQPRANLKAVRNASGIKLTWDIPDLRPGVYSRVALYEIFMLEVSQQETGSWYKIGYVQAATQRRPFSAEIGDLPSNRKLYFAIRAKDIHDRIGTFSKKAWVAM